MPGPCQLLRHIRCPAYTEGLKGQIAGWCWPCWTPSGCRSSSCKSSAVAHGPLDKALVVMVQIGTFCIFVFCAGLLPETGQEDELEEFEAMFR